MNREMGGAGLGDFRECKVGQSHLLTALKVSNQCWTPQLGRSCGSFLDQVQLVGLPIQLTILSPALNQFLKQAGLNHGQSSKQLSTQSPACRCNASAQFFELIGALVQT